MENLYEMGLKIPKCPDCKREMELAQRTLRILYATEWEDKDELRTTDHLWCHRCQTHMAVRRRRPAPDEGNRQ